MSDSTGGVVETYEYSVYGEPVIRDASNQILPDSTIGNPYLFTGRRYDSETGLFYYRARYYAPGIGRFTKRDPFGWRPDDVRISYAGSTFDRLIRIIIEQSGTFDPRLSNPYSYVSNNPIVYVDPLGLKEWIYVITGGGLGVGPLAGEGGQYFLIDSSSGDIHTWYYLSGGVGLGRGAAVQIEAGVFYGPDDATTIHNWSLTVSGFAARGTGYSGQITGTSFWGGGDLGLTGGFAAGAGYSIAGMATRSWYKGTENIAELPQKVRELVDRLKKGKVKFR